MNKHPFRRSPVGVAISALLTGVLGACGSDTSQFGGDGGGSPTPPVTADWQITQLTTSTQPTDDFVAPSSSATGAVISFISVADPLGSNTPRMPELFIQTSTGLAQLTRNLRPGVGVTAQQLAGQGNRVAFSAEGEYTASANPDGDSEVFVVDANGSNLRQLTQSPQGFGAFGPQISSDGQRVAFISRADYACANCDNADESAEVFLINADGSGLFQVTNMTGFTTGVQRISLAGDGSVIALELAADPLATNSDGSREIFLVSATGAGLRQLTSSLFDSRYPSLSGNGAVVSFQSLGDLVPGGNTTRISQVYAVNADGSGLIQLTHVDSTSSGAGLASGGGVSANGTVVTFTSTADLTGDNSQRVRTVFQVGVDGKNMQQVVANSPLSSADRSAVAPSASADGKIVAFHSAADFAGTNADGGTEIFVARAVTN